MHTTNRLKNHRGSYIYIGFLLYNILDLDVIPDTIYYMEGAGWTVLCIGFRSVFAFRIASRGEGQSKTECCTQQSRNKIENFENCQRNNILCIKFRPTITHKTSLRNGGNTHADGYDGSALRQKISKFAQQICNDYSAFHIYIFIFLYTAYYENITRRKKQQELVQLL